MKKTKKEILIYFIVVASAIIIFKNYIIGHYAVDTYAIANLGYKEYAIKIFLKAGRPFSCMLLLIADLINLPIKVLVMLSTIMAIFISALSIMKLREIILKNKNVADKYNELIVIAISFCTVFNFMYIENLYFAEASIMATAVYLSIVAANQLLNLEKHNMIKSLMILLIAIFSYNAVINVYITSVVFLLIIDKNSRTKKEIAKLFLSACTICLITIVLNFAQIKCICNGLALLQNRISSQTNYFTNIAYIFLNCGDVLISTANLFPKYYFIAFLIATLIPSMLYLYKTNKKINEEIILFILVSIMSSFAISVFTLSSFGTGRLLTPIGMLIGYLFMIIYIKTDIFESKKIIGYYLKVILSIYLIINVANFYNITKEQQEINEIEKSKVKEINEYINCYEKENNIQVKHITMKYVKGCKDKAFYKKITSTNCIAVYAEASYDGVINFYTGRKLKKIGITEELNQKYEEKTRQIGENIYCCVDDVLICLVYVV